ncbi:uncharacterized protein Dsimw501_GD23345, isoform B [Drosophila simulans]|uniref:Thioredoxin domain-containing protein 17 n=2 Tax=melanogaster subgroup TaxID=32351 RepID=A0A0J9QX63_DROSI|nr:uncharacterized protein Dsimw501_GD23345, isoform B [Drosophila simulans]
MAKYRCARKLATLPSVTSIPLQKPVTSKFAITSLPTLFGRILRRYCAVNTNPSKIMVVTHNVKGYDEFSKKMEELENGNEPVHVLFSGGKDENGESWCPYCVKAEPVIHDALKKAPGNSHFVHVDVGERAYWKDLNCPFRKDPNTHLIFLPTLLRWKRPQRLDGERCSNQDLVEMMFEDED